MKRLFVALLAFAGIAFSGLASAQEISGTSLFQTRIVWQRLDFRNTSAATTARVANWAAPKNTIGFADSNVYRKGTAGLTTYDTTMAYPVQSFAIPNGAFAQQVTGADTLIVPWLIIRMRQDTTSNVATLGAVPTALDSFRVGAQVSMDGVNWVNANGTPTRAFDSVYFTSSEDGTQLVDLAAAEPVLGADFAQVTLGCTPSTVVAGGSPIINKTLCLCGMYVRFIFGNDGVGQFAVDAGTFEKTQ